MPQVHPADGPLHSRVAAALREQIRSGLLDGPLPSEAALVAEHGVSRSVVRQAMTTLEREGLITKLRGKGSFVRRRTRIHRIVQSLNGLGMQLDELRTAHTTTVLSRHVGPFQDVPPGWSGGDALHLERLRTAAGEPVALIRTMLPAEFADVLTTEALTDSSLHELLRTRAGVTLERSRRTVVAEPAPATVAEHLRCQTGAPLLVLAGHTYDSTGRVVEVFTTYHRGDLVTFDLETTIDAGRPPHAS